MKTILLVEDDVQLARTCVKILERAGYTVLAEEAGDAGVATFAQKPVDLVVVDMFLPGTMDGYEVIDACRRIRPGIPILGVSGGGGFSDAHHLLRGARELGAMVTLPKPFSASELTEIVGRIFEVADNDPKKRRGFFDVIRRPKNK